MTRKNIHPDYHEVEVSVIHKDGKKETFRSRSTFNGDKLVSEVDLSKHMAWADAVVNAGDSINVAMQKFHRRLQAKK